MLTLLCAENEVWRPTWQHIKLIPGLLYELNFIITSSHTFRRLLKTHCFQQAFGSPYSGSSKCLRFGNWLTLCTLNIHLLTYLLTYLLFTEIKAYLFTNLSQQST